MCFALQSRDGNRALLVPEFAARHFRPPHSKRAPIPDQLKRLHVGTGGTDGEIRREHWYRRGRAGKCLSQIHARAVLIEDGEKELVIAARHGLFQPSQPVPVQVPDELRFKAMSGGIGKHLHVVSSLHRGVAIQPAEANFPRRGGGRTVLPGDAVFTPQTVVVAPAGSGNAGSKRIGRGAMTAFCESPASVVN